MDPRDFHTVASALAGKEAPSAAELRTAVSRAYYALYNTAVDLLGKCGATVVDNQEGHRAVPRALRMCEDKGLREIAAVLDELRGARWEADYAMNAAAPEHQKTVKKHVAHARQAVRMLDACKRDADRFPKVSAALRRWAVNASEFRVD